MSVLLSPVSSLLSIPLHRRPKKFKKLSKKARKIRATKKKNLLEKEAKIAGNHTGITSINVKVEAEQDHTGADQDQGKAEIDEVGEDLFGQTGQKASTAKAETAKNTVSAAENNNGRVVNSADHTVAGSFVGEEGHAEGEPEPHVCFFRLPDPREKVLMADRKAKKDVQRARKAKDRENAKNKRRKEREKRKAKGKGQKRGRKPTKKAKLDENKETNKNPKSEKVKKLKTALTQEEKEEKAKVRKQKKEQKLKEKSLQEQDSGNDEEIGKTIQ